jgi:MFS family permease
LTSKVSLEHRVPFFYGWVVLCVAALGVFMSGPAQTYGVSIFIDPIIAELGLPRSTISASYSVATILAGLSMLVLGRYLDRAGARRVITLLAILYGIACFGMATISDPIGLFIGFAALRVIGSAALVLACTTLAAVWFVRARGRAMSIVMLGIAFSNAVMPPLLQFLVNAYGWRMTWVVVGLAIWVALIVPSAVFIRNRPEAVGLRPDGDAPVTDAGSVTARVVEYTWTYQQAIRSRTFWLLVVAALAPGMVQTGLMFHQVSYFTSVGLTAELAASVLSIYAIAFAVMTVIVGRALERVPERYVLMSGLLLLPVAVLWLMFMTHPWQAVLYGVLLGMVGGIHSTTSSVLWAGYYGRQHLGSIRGITQAAIATSAAAGPLILGVPFDLVGSYAPGLWFMIAMPLVCALAALIAGPPGPPPVHTRVPDGHRKVPVSSREVGPAE